MGKPNKLVGVLKSRKFWATAFGSIAVAVGAHFDLPPSATNAIVVLVASYILGTAHEDAAGSRGNTIELDQALALKKLPSRSRVEDHD